MTYPNARIEVTITGVNHPHRGEHGYIKVVDNRVQSIKVGKLRMWEIVLEDCKHGTGGAFATSSDFKLSRVAEKLMQKLIAYLYSDEAKEGEK